MGNTARPMRFRLHLIILLLVSFSFTTLAHSVEEWDDYYEVEHSWKYKGKECSITLNISKNLYNYYRNDREHLAYVYQFNDGELPPNYYSFMLSEHDRPVMQSIAQEFSRYALTEKDRIELALTFVQSLRYAFDADSKGKDEYVRYPVETLVDGCGDCEDKVALLVALLYEMDIDFVLLVLPEHMALGSCPSTWPWAYIATRWRPTVICCSRTINTITWRRQCPIGKSGRFLTII